MASLASSRLHQDQGRRGCQGREKSGIPGQRPTEDGTEDDRQDDIQAPVFPVYPGGSDPGEKKGGHEDQESPDAHLPP